MDLSPGPSPPPSPPARFSKPGPSQQHDSSSVDTSDIRAIQCWVYDDTPPNTKCDTIDENQIGSWLCKAGPISLNNKPPSAGLRLICRNQEKSVTTPFEEDTLKAINKVLGLPESHAYLSTRDAGVCGHYLGNRHQPVFIYHRSNNDGTISAALKYDSDSNITVGYILLGPRISPEAVQTAIISQFPNFSHPLLVPILATELTAADLLKELSSVHQSLAKIERDTGYGDWKAAAIEISRETCRQWARDLGVLSCRFAFLEVAVRCTTMVNEFTLQEMDSMRDCVPASTFRHLKVLTSSLKNRAEFLLSNLRHMQMFGAISQRMQAQQNVLFNLVSQQDNNLNFGIARDSKEIAAASKRDSSAMKIIAVLTTIFLPGTFISTFFAMPLFNWTASSMGKVMTGHFWVYWAVTAPLTVFVLAVVTTFAIYQARQNKAEAEKARNSTEMD